MEAAQLLKPETSQAEAPKAETPAPAVTPDKFAALSRREAQAVRREREAKALMAQIKAQQDALAKEREEIAQFKALKSNPLKALEHVGVDYQTLSQQVINNGNVTPEMRIQQLQERLDAMARERDEEKAQTAQQREAQAKAEEAEAVKEYQSAIASMVEKAKDKFPLTHLYNRADLVYAIIDHHFNKTLQETGAGEEMPIEKASELVEARLLKEWQRAQETISKRQAESAPKTPPKPSVRIPEEQRWVEKQPKTIAGLTQATPSAKPTHYLSDQERVANALAKLRALSNK